MQAWSGKTAVVCGASAGLGRQLVLQLAKSNIARLALVARRQSPLVEWCEECRARFPNTDFRPYTADLSDSQQAFDCAAHIHDQLGNPDLLVQAIGQSDRGQIKDLKSSRLISLVDANVTTSLNAIQAFLPGLTSQGGTIVLLGSLSSLFAPRFLGGYAIAKHALAGLAQQLRLELADDHVHVLLACPGPIRRDDEGTRYTNLSGIEQLPAEALRPGGGAKLSGLNAERLAYDILKAAASKKPTLIRPRSARFLLALSAFAPSLAEFILKKKTS